MRFLFLISLRNIQPQPISIQIQLILPARILQNGSNIPRVLNPPQIDVASALLDGVADEFGGAGFTLRADDGGLFFLAGFVDDEGGSLGFLLGDLFGFDGGGEFGGEGEVLLGWGLVRRCVGMVGRGERTVRETSSSMMLKRDALRDRFSRTSLATISRCVMS